MSKMPGVKVSVDLGGSGIGIANAEKDSAYVISALPLRCDLIRGVFERFGAMSGGSPGQQMTNVDWKWFEFASQKSIGDWPGLGLNRPINSRIAWKVVKHALELTDVPQMRIIGQVDPS